MAHKPYITYIPKVGEYHWNNKITGKYVPTYAQFKKEVKELLKETSNNEVHIVRERRGEWGEWFEYWSLVNNKPTIIKSGWN